MAAMALISLVVGLRTVSFRRSRDQEPLGYLPDDTNVMAGVHVAKALETGAGRDVLTQLRLGASDVGLVHLERWIGLGLEDLADVVLGMKVDDRLPPRVTLVVRTRKPYNEAKVRAALKDGQALERRQKQLVRFHADKTPLTATIWLAAPSTLVLGLDPADLDAVPLTPHAGIGHLEEPLQRFLEDPRGAKAHAWVAGHSEHWDRTALGTLLGALAGQNLELLKGLRAAEAWVRFDQAVTVDVECRCADDAAAGALAAFLRRAGAADKWHVATGEGGQLTAHDQFDPDAFLLLMKGRW